MLSAGRAVCGIGAAWFEREHKAYGFDFPPVRGRFELLEDALGLLSVMWGPGAPAFEGSVVSVPEAICYPRPVQERIPILVGGSGEQKTLRLVAKYADACNLFGDPATVRHKLDVLRRHCAEVGRDPSAIEVTHLSSALVTDDPSTPVHGSTVPGKVDDHVGRYRELAEAGVGTAIVRLAPVPDEAAIEAFAPVLAAFSPRRGWRRPWPPSRRPHGSRPRRSRARWSPAPSPARRRSGRCRSA